MRMVISAMVCVLVLILYSSTLLADDIYLDPWWERLEEVKGKNPTRDHLGREFDIITSEKCLDTDEYKCITNICDEIDMEDEILKKYMYEKYNRKFELSQWSEMGGSYMWKMSKFLHNYENDSIFKALLPKYFSILYNKAKEAHEKYNISSKHDRVSFMFSYTYGYVKIVIPKYTDREKAIQENKMPYTQFSFLLPWSRVEQLKEVCERLDP